MVDAPPTTTTARTARAGLAVFVFVLILALFPLSTRPAIDVKIWLYHAAAALFGGGWMAGVALGWMPMRWPRLFGPVLVLSLVANVIALAFSDHIAQGSVAVAQTFSLWMLFLVASQVYASARAVKPLLIAVCVAVAISSLYAFAQKAGIDPFPWNEQEQQTSTYLELPGTFGNPNVAGHALVLAIVLALSLAASRGTRWCVLLVPIYGLHLYWTGFRAGLLALAGGAIGVLITWLAIRAKRSPVATARITVATLLLFAAAASVALFVYGSAQSSNFRLLDDSLMLRYNAYYGAADMIADRPITGFGPGTYAIENPPYWTEYEQRWLAEKRLRNDHVHSDVLETWVETGVLGVAAYVLLLLCGVYYAAARAARSRDDRWLSLGLVAFFVTFAVDGLFGFNGRVPVTAVLVMLAAAALEGFEGCEGFERRRFSAWGRVVAASLLLTMLLAAFVGTRSFTAGTYAYIARSALNGQAIGDAVQWANHAVAVDPNHPEARQASADAALAARETDTAIDGFTHALQSRPHDLTLHLGLSRAHLASAAEAVQQGNRDETLAALQRAAEAAVEAETLCPVFPDAHELLGRVALMRAQLVDPALAREAEERFTAALRNGSANAAPVLVLAANARLVLDDLDGAEEYFVRAVQREPESETAWDAYVAFATQHGRLKRAKTLIDEAIAHADRTGGDKLRGSLRAWRGVTRARTGAAGESVADGFDAALELAPTTSHVWRAYANAAREVGVPDRFVAAVLDRGTALRHTEALRVLLQGALADGSRQIRTALENVLSGAYVGIMREDIAALLPYAIDYIEKQPESDAVVNAYQDIALTYSVLQDHTAAAEVCARAAELSSGQMRANALAFAGDQYLLANEGEAALTLLEPVVGQFPSHVNLRLVYARALAAAGKPASARMELNALLRFQLNPEQRAAVQAAADQLSQ